MLPNRYYDPARRYVKELVDRSTIKDNNQKIVDEVYSISLFIPDIAHPLIVLPSAEFSASVDGVEVMNTRSDPKPTFLQAKQELEYYRTFF
ncbi:MAG TPA: hypothetical protein VE548_03365 [Nitrososphaeraceae archaeon]|nr:hypothetical protein [Nitrososphaeraceae archaeon]